MLRPVRVVAPVAACAVAQDGAHVLVALGKGFLFRYEYVASDAALDGSEDACHGEDGKENGAGNVEREGPPSA